MWSILMNPIQVIFIQVVSIVVIITQILKLTDMLLALQNQNNVLRKLVSISKKRIANMILRDAQSMAPSCPGCPLIVQ